MNDDDDYDDDSRLVSVILPAYNPPSKYLMESIDSVLSQSYTRLELLIINDGSTDSTTSKIIDEYSIADARVRVITNLENEGIARSLNKGLDESRGAFICRMDADDVMMASRIQNQVRYLDENPRIDILGTAAEVFKDNVDATRLVRFPSDIGWNHFNMFLNCCLIHPTVMMRRSVVDFTLRYSDSMDCRHVEDLDLWLTVICRGEFRISNTKEKLLRLRKHAGNVSKIHRQTQRRNSIDVVRKHLASLVLIDSIDSEAIDCAMFPDNAASIEAFEKAYDLVEKLAQVFKDRSNHLNHTERMSAQEEANNKLGQLVTMAMSKFPSHSTTLWTRWLRRDPMKQILQLTELISSGAKPPPSIPRNNNNNDMKSPSSTLQVIVFSKDRAFQLKEYLRTLFKFNSSSSTIRVSVLYQTSTDGFSKSYDRVKQRFPDVLFVRERSFGHQLQDLVRDCQSEFLMFGVDDVLFYRLIGFDSAFELMRSNPSVLSYHLKMSADITYCHTADRDVELPTSLRSIEPSSSIWSRKDGSHEWNYPFELCASVYRSLDVDRILTEIKTSFGEFEGLGHPNRLEAFGNKVTADLLEQRPMCACPRVAPLSVITVNRVQSVLENRIYLEIDLDTMDSHLWNDREFDTDHYASKRFHSVHIGDFVLK